MGAAVKELRTSGGALVFAHGRYLLSPKVSTAMAFEGVDGVEVDGDGSLLLFSGKMTPFSFHKCSNIFVHDLTIDWNPPPYSQGTVVASGDRWFDVDLDAGYSAISTAPIDSYVSFDRDRVLATYNFVSAYGKVDHVERADERRIRIVLRPGPATGQTSTRMPTNTAVVLRFARTNWVASVRNSRQVRFSRCVIHASPNGGIFCSRCTDLNFDELTYSIPAGTGRLLSTVADAIYLVGCDGSVSVTHCRFQGMGDDGINIHSPLWKVARRLDSHTIEIHNGRGMPIAAELLPQNGDILQFLDPQDLATVGEAAVASVQEASATLLFSRALPGGVDRDSWVADVNQSPRSSVCYCNFLGNLGRAVTAHSDLEVADCHISGCAFAAVLIAPDRFFFEGPAASNVIVRNNDITDCHYARPTDYEGSIVVDVMDNPFRRFPMTRRVNHDIQILNNTINHVATAGISVRAASGVKIVGNHIGETWVGSNGKTHDAIILDTVSDCEVRDNISGKIVMRNCDRTVTLRDNKGYP